VDKSAKENLILLCCLTQHTGDPACAGRVSSTIYGKIYFARKVQDNNCRVAQGYSWQSYWAKKVLVGKTAGRLMQTLGSLEVVGDIGNVQNK